MIDLGILRKQPELIRDGLKKRNLSLDLDALCALDAERLTLKQQLEALQAQRNSVSKEIPTLSDAQIKQEKITAMKEVNIQIAQLEAQLEASRSQYESLIYALPNFLDPTTAIGPDDSGNIVESTYKTPTQFSFQPQHHADIGAKRDWIDSEKWAEISGSRFWYLKGDIVLLQFAIIQFALQHLVKEGFTPIIPPYLVREQAMFGTGFFPADPNEIYQIPAENGESLFLIGTSEVSLTSYHANEIIDVTTPKMYLGYSPCFRGEAGTYGKDMRGILRWHQFEKVEMVCFCKPEDSVALHNKMVAIEESFWQALDIPYQKLNVCSGDLWNPALKKYDLEAWMPGQNKYREVTSCSNIGSFQSRRLGIKYRKQDGSTDYVHTLNGSVVALSRCLIALIENYQNEDGTIRVPAVLQPFLWKDIL
jgi:seryl-tRNA synthetase